MHMHHMHRGKEADTADTADAVDTADTTDMFVRRHYRTRRSSGSDRSIGWMGQKSTGDCQNKLPSPERLSRTSMLTVGYAGP